MTDDQGYGISSTFGGVIPTPTLDRVANAGLRYTEFNSTALCSPTRAALITGRNHHEGGLWRDREAVDRFSGIRCLHRHGQRHDRQNPQRARLRDVVVRQEPQHAGLPDQHGGPVRSVALWDGLPVLLHTQIFPWLDKPGYNLTTDMADEAVKAEAPGQPFFLYYAPGGSHSPPQPTPEWIEKFRGKFDMGWNAMRDVIFANQKWLGVIPADAELTPWPDSLAKWETLSADEKRLFARQAEVFAAYTAYTDYEIGRVIQEVQDQGKLDNTLIIYICGDNGTSPGGTLLGTPNQYTSYNGFLEVPVEEQLKFYDVWGSPPTYPHMAVAWSWAFDTPFKWTKQVASHFGGTRQGMAISWPARIKDAGGIRGQFHHMIDVVPTILEATGIRAPESVDGIAQNPIEGVSMAYTFDKASASAASTRTTQYFEMAGNRGIYHDGWYANTTPPVAPWILNAKMPDLDDYKWELYKLVEDYSQARDIAAQMPDKLKEMQGRFDEEAKKYNVYPLDNSAFARAITPRPS